MGIAQLIGIFLTGLLAGGLSCMAVQGGLLAATLAQRHEQGLKKKLQHGKTVSDAFPISIFLLSKLVGYTILGALLGWIGSTLQLSLTVQVLLQIAVGVFMLGTALHLLNVHPVFRYFIIQPPYFLARFIRKESKSRSIFAPLILGFFTIFIPCGTTQAMMALSIASANPLWGALILFAFVLGTSPIFFVLGFFASKLTLKTKGVFTKLAAIILLTLSLYNLNNAVALSGSPVTLDSLAQGAYCLVGYCEQLSTIPDPQNDTAITITEGGYTPGRFSVHAGQNVTLRLTNTDNNNCAQAFTIPQLGVRQIVPQGTSKTISFRAPQQPGRLSFMCSMGMYRGTIYVI